MSVQTFSKTLEPSGSISGKLLDVSVTIPVDLSNNKIPITVTIGSKEGGINAGENDTGNDINNLKLLCYYYSISRRSDKNDVVSTVLLDTSIDSVRDTTRQLSTLLCKKYRHPCYVAWSSDASNTNDMFDQISIIKTCVQYIHDKIST
ncbi:hypothetical protein Kpol_1072p27 [Vanderwaltozyma polyspora DSM 70294]|uniref:Uncharacterized protein n=1 Tax=Vanderwaltozyma polyspora (strain ATCC 22028 / DSM 70294 / BCRC 21397 / CBS 2163 / NBRC 10782 / NRRL Y-8283 / UCD 57-17) TaxID=436907 RepID=A7TKP5_VANPO|nr:uncharacterized protein Kpol_1072p27 [Vanderwaltozyma polyspora DSM 70294]EDO17157.1 hypothetical protein Kpol_1072p27 [Vanderwaltozyma polyspora DSM 70294]